MHKKIFLLLSVIFIICAQQSTARDLNNNFRKPLAVKIVSQKDFDGNNLRFSVTNRGSLMRDLTSGNASFYFPKESNLTIVYASGLWIGGKVNDEIRLSGAEYDYYYSPGPIINGTYSNPDLPLNRIYKINLGETKSADYLEWPAEYGAPVDAYRKPLVTDNQTLWTVYNDLNPQFRREDYGTVEPLGIEVQLTVFGFDFGEPLGNGAFLKFLIINKGGSIIKDMYISIWSDVDLGVEAGDDLVGCDTTLGLGYSYNGDADDAGGYGYGSRVPAVGFDFIQGPIVPASPDDKAYSFGRYIKGYKNLPTTSFIAILKSSPQSGDPSIPEHSYLLMQGIYKDKSIIINPTTGKPTKFMFSGDPTTRTGWLDFHPSDRRMMVNTGPFSMAPKDSQEVVVSVIVGQGDTPLESVTLMKKYSTEAQKFYDSRFTELSGPSRPGRPVVLDIGNGKDLSVSWTKSFYQEPVNYKIFYGTSSKVYTDSVNAGNSTSIIIKNLIEGKTYYFAVKAISNDGLTSLLSLESSGIPRTIPLAPANFSVSHNSLIPRRVLLNWDSNTELDFAGYNLYKAESFGGQYIKINKDLIKTNNYIDENLKSKWYYYSITAVDKDGNESIKSKEDKIRPITLDSGILVVDETYDGDGDFLSPTDEEADNFYRRVLTGFNFVETDVDSIDELDDISMYSTVIYHADDLRAIKLLSKIDILREYLLHGGKLIIIGWRLAEGISGISKSPFFFPSKIRNVFGILSADNTFSSNLNVDGTFMSAKGESGYRDLEIDVAKILSNWNGRLKRMDYLIPKDEPNLKVFYRFNSSDTNSPFHNKPVAISYTNTYGWLHSYKVVIIDIPLYYFVESQVKEVLKKILTEEIGEKNTNQNCSDKSNSENVIKEYKLYQNYPNPFNPKTVIEYDLKEKSFVKLEVYNILGQRVKLLVNELQFKGKHKVTLDGSEFASGIYFYKLAIKEVNSPTNGKSNKSISFEKINKMLILK